MLLIVDFIRYHICNIIQNLDCVVHSRFSIIWVMVTAAVEIGECHGYATLPVLPQELDAFLPVMRDAACYESEIAAFGLGIDVVDIVALGKHGIIKRTFSTEYRMSSLTFPEKFSGHLEEK